MVAEMVGDTSMFVFWWAVREKPSARCLRGPGCKSRANNTTNNNKLVRRSPPRRNHFNGGYYPTLPYPTLSRKASLTTRATPGVSANLLSRGRSVRHFFGVDQRREIEKIDVEITRLSRASKAPKTEEESRGKLSESRGAAARNGISTNT